MKSQWSREERLILKKYYKKVPLDNLMTLLPGRDKTSIYNQVRYLRKRNWTFGD